MSCVDHNLDGQEGDISQGETQIASEENSVEELKSIESDDQNNVDVAEAVGPLQKKELVQKLKDEERQLDRKLEELQAITSERKKVMDALHEYNDIKDATQMVLGLLANLHEVTVAELHEKYDLMNE